MKISGKKILITGAASGIGRATALKMGELKAKLFLTDLNEEGLEQTAMEIERNGGIVELARPVDVSDYSAMKDLADEMHRDFSVLDILINNAGVAIFAQLEDMTHEDWQKVINVNLWGVVHGIECFAPEMIKRGDGGHIVNISSTAGLIGLPWHIAYSASKHAVVGISEVMRYDLKKHGIDVTVICPGAVDTGMVESVDIRGDANKISGLKKHFRKAAISPEKVALQIVNAVEKKQFLVITSGDIKLVYFLKKKMFPAFHGIMRVVSKQMDSRLS